jgi:hypothetical protein
LSDYFLKIYPPFGRYGLFPAGFAEFVAIQGFARAFLPKKTACIQVLAADMDTK